MRTFQHFQKRNFTLFWSGSKGCTSSFWIVHKHLHLIVIPQLPIHSTNHKQLLTMRPTSPSATSSVLRLPSIEFCSNNRANSKAWNVLGVDPSKKKAMAFLGISEDEFRNAQRSNEERRYTSLSKKAAAVLGISPADAKSLRLTR